MRLSRFRDSFIEQHEPQAWHPVVSKPDEKPVGSILRDTLDFSFVYLLPSNFKLELFKQTPTEISLGYKANLK